MTIRDRLSLFVQKTTVKKLLTKTSISQSNLYRVRDAKVYSVEVLEEMFKAFPNLSPDWVVKGTGEMFVNYNNIENYNNVENILVARESENKYNTEGVIERMERRLTELEQEVKALKSKK